MPEIFERFTSIEILRLFLHGLFFVFPLTLFPRFVGTLGSVGFITLVVFSGAVLYASPVDAAFRVFRRDYKAGIDNFIEKIVGIDRSKLKCDFRSLYDIVFYRRLGSALRTRIHFMVSLYYFYSRTFAACAFYLVFSFCCLLLLSGFISGTVSWLPSLLKEDIASLNAKLWMIVIFTACTSAFSFVYARNTLRSVVSLENAVIIVYKEDLKKIANLAVKSNS